MSKEKITVSEIVDLMAAKNNFSKKQTEEFVKVMLSTIEDVLIDGDVVKMKDFGTFKPQWNEPRKSVDVNTGEEITVPGYYKVVFIPDNNFKDLINLPFSHLQAIEQKQGISTEKTTESPFDYSEDKKLASKVLLDNKKITQEPLRVFEEQAAQIKDLLSEITALSGNKKSEEEPQQQEKTLTPVTENEKPLEREYFDGEEENYVDEDEEDVETVNYSSEENISTPQVENEITEQETNEISEEEEEKQEIKTTLFNPYEDRLSRKQRKKQEKEEQKRRRREEIKRYFDENQFNVVREIHPVDVKTVASIVGFADDKTDKVITSETSSDETTHNLVAAETTTPAEVEVQETQDNISENLRSETPETVEQDAEYEVENPINIENEEETQTHEVHQEEPVIQHTEPQEVIEENAHDETVNDDITDLETSDTETSHQETSPVNVENEEETQTHEVHQEEPEIIQHTEPQEVTEENAPDETINDDITDLETSDTETSHQETSLVNVENEEETQTHEVHQENPVTQHTEPEKPDEEDVTEETITQNEEVIPQVQLHENATPEPSSEERTADSLEEKYEEPVSFVNEDIPIENKNEIIDINSQAGILPANNISAETATPIEQTANNTEEIDYTFTSRRKRNKRWFWFIIFPLLLLAIAFGVWMFYPQIKSRIKPYIEKVIAKTEKKEAVPAKKVQLPATDSLNTTSVNPNDTANLIDVFNQERDYKEFLSTSEITTKEKDIKRIAKDYYGNDAFWIYIYEANNEVIEDPRNIPVGTPVKIPKLDPRLINVNNPECIKLAKKLTADYLRN